MPIAIAEIVSLCIPAPGWGELDSLPDEFRLRRSTLPRQRCLRRQVDVGVDVVGEDELVVNEGPIPVVAKELDVAVERVIVKPLVVVVVEGLGEAPDCGQPTI
jgi:hypothetical protein